MVAHSGMSASVTPPTDRRLAKFEGDRIDVMMRSLILSLLLAVMLPVFADAVALPGKADFSAGMRDYDAGKFKSAVAAFGRAAALEPENDVFAYWVGKACGRVAERAGPISAIKWAGRTRDALERAVELNPENLDAVGALAQYYEDAPGFLGGDAAKARDLRARLSALAQAALPASTPGTGPVAAKPSAR